MIESVPTAPDNWKERLRDTFIAGITGNPSEKIRSFTSIGYFYQCCAPAVIYKYFPPERNRFEIIKNSKLWYSAPSKFNDIFDTDFPIDEKAMFENTLRQLPNGKGIRVGSTAWRNIQSKVPGLMRQLHNSMDRIKCSTGVACFSESCESLLMWAHYAKNHQGFCAEYELLKFSTELKFSPVPVIYSNERPLLSSVDINDIQASTMPFFFTCLTSKSPEWSYENEWRIVQDNGACGEAWDEAKQGALLSSITPNSIILGSNSPKEIEREAYDYCEAHRIGLFKMIKDERVYRLNKKPLLTFE